MIYHWIEVLVATMKLQLCLLNKDILKLGHTIELENQPGGMHIPGNQRISLEACILSMTITAPAMKNISHLSKTATSIYVSPKEKHLVNMDHC
jgi:hypothetical protein